MSTDEKPIVWVTGDVILAWDLVHKTGDANPDSAYVPADDSLEVYRQAGGAWFTRKLLEEMKQKKNSNWEIVGVGPGGEGIELKDFDNLAHAYAVWTEYPAVRNQGDDKNVRVKSYLGTQKRPKDNNPDQAWFPEALGKNVNGTLVKLVVVTDDGIEDKCAEHRPDLIPALLDLAAKGKLPWIVSKDRTTHQDLIHALSGGKAISSTHDDALPALLNGKGTNSQTPTILTEEQIRSLHERAIAVVPIDVLRREDHRIGHGLSWESLADDSLNAVTTHSKISLFRWVIVSYSNVGALIVSKPGSPSDRKAWLVLDPAELEDSWNRRYPGQMVGSTTCLVVTVAKAMIEWLTQNGGDSSQEPTEIKLIEAVKEGLFRMRALHYLGYSATSPKTWVARIDPGLHDKRNPTTYCMTEEIETIEKKPGLKQAIGSRESFIEYPLPIPPPRQTILEARLCSGRAEKVAENIVKYGPKHEKALATIPRAEYGNLVTTDPKEIDALQAIATLLRSYIDNPGDKPISIAVFGQPGSGKSFGVTQIAKQLGDKIGDKPLTFNLSQFNDPDMLIGAFHQIRDEGLKGKIPLVFWDEFDTALDGKPKGWLRYFLAPMQDGQFQEGQVTHPIGRAIFVFAGGTCEKMEDFYPGSSENSNQDEQRNVKVPDFASRLRGSLDVLGLNPLVLKPELEANTEPHLMVRRALILYQHLKKFDGLLNGKGIDISDGVLDAFLRIGKYNYGARSMEAIVRMSTLKGARKFTASCLPSEKQLNLHVNGEKFLKLAGR